MIAPGPHPVSTGGHTSMFKKITTLLTGLLYTASLAIAVVIAYVIISNKPLPRGVVGPEAERLTDSMMHAMNCDAWDRLRYVAWSHQGRHHYVWDKLYNLAEVQYGDVRVLLNVNMIDGIVWKDGRRLLVEEKHKYITQAWKMWCHDSFWLNPVCKLRDAGVVRRLVTAGDSSQTLLVTYTKGGLSPGDSYLWKVNEDYIPIYWRMWARIFPIRGLKATWENWSDIDGVPVSTKHRVGPYRIEISNLRSGSHHSVLGLERDPFVDFVTG